MPLMKVRRCWTLDLLNCAYATLILWQAMNGAALHSFQ